MSFEIDWEGLTSDASITQRIRDFLDQQFNSILLPPFIDEISVTDFSMGTISPEIIIRQIGVPFDEFYNDTNSDDDERRDPTLVSNPLSSSENSSSCEGDEDPTNVGNIADNARSGYSSESQAAGTPEVIKQLHKYNMNNLGLGSHESELSKAIFKSSNIKISTFSKPPLKDFLDKSNDIQFVLEIDYRGNMMIEVSVNLLVNYPSRRFISLPIKLKITDLEIHSLAAIAYFQESVFVSFLCDLNTSRPDYFSIPNSQSSGAANKSKSFPATLQGGNFVEYGTASNKERIDVIRGVKIDTEIGENENNVLRNVGKVEKFLVEQLRSIIRDEVCWPGWVCIDLGDEDSSLDIEM